MRKFAIAAVALLAIAGSTAVYAQHRHWGYGHSRMNPEDRAAYADARIAAVHAGLKLTADQEKLWPPVEAAVRDFAKLRIDRANARMNAQRDGSQDQQKPADPVAQRRRLTWPNRFSRLLGDKAFGLLVADLHACPCPPPPSSGAGSPRSASAAPPAVASGGYAPARPSRSRAGS